MLVGRAKTALALMAALFLALAACAPEEAPDDEAAPDPDEEPAEEVAEDWPDRLVLGMVPSREADVMIETIEPLTEHLAAELGVEVEGFVPTDFTGLIEAMGTDQADIGIFGPFGVVQAVERYDVEPVLQTIRFGSVSYVSQWFTNDPDKYCTDEPVADEDGFLSCNGVLDAEEGPVGEDAVPLIEGASVAYVDPASTSGYIFPAVQLLQQGLDPQADVESVFAGGHDAAVIAVYNEDTEVGVSFDDARGDVVDEFPDVGEQVVVFAWTPEIPNDGWVVRRDLPDDLKEQIVEIMVAYSQTDEGTEILDELYNVTELVPAEPGAYDIVAEAARELDVEGD
jgi:phosphonate transport system substrate-binding protein